MISSGRAKTGLVLGAEFLTPITDWTDRSTCVLFGDGAGAAVVTQATDERGILSTYIGSGGDASHLLYCIGHGTAGSLNNLSGLPEDGEALLQMNGNEVFKHAVRTMEKAAVQALSRAQLKAEELDLARPASGQYPHHRRHRRALEDAQGKGAGYHSEIRQQFFRVDSLRPR